MERFKKLEFFHREIYPLLGLWQKIIDGFILNFSCKCFLNTIIFEYLKTPVNYLASQYIWEPSISGVCEKGLAAAKGGYSMDSLESLLGLNPPTTSISGFQNAASLRGKKN